MFADQTLLARAIWSALAGLIIWAVATARWELGFVALVTLSVSVAPLIVARLADIHVPPSFIAAVVVFVGGTLFLGEVLDFYNRFWWWDVAMHGGSAIGFGLIGFVLVFMMFQGDRFAAPPFAMAVFAFCFAMAIGSLWEVFEFVMDQSFGLNMQKSGLPDTMGDLIVDALGGLSGASVGYLYLKGQARGGVSRVIEEFVQRNPRYFRRWRK